MPIVAAVEMIDGPRLFSNFAGTWRFEALGDETTRATLQYSFITAWGGLRLLLRVARSNIRLSGRGRTGGGGKPFGRRKQR